MKQVEATQLTRIYNTLLLVNTHGEDTMVMGDCLKAFKQFLANATIEEEETDNKEG